MAPSRAYDIWVGRLVGMNGMDHTRVSLGVRQPNGSQREIGGILKRHLRAFSQSSPDGRKMVTVVTISLSRENRLQGATPCE